MNSEDQALIIDKYRRGYAAHGHSPNALGWDKGNQDIRFNVLLSFFSSEGRSFLDIGCGFGDLNRVLARKYGASYTYLGIDLVDELINEGRSYYSQDNVRFINADFLKFPFTETFDVVIASGIFNHKFASSANDSFVNSVLSKAWDLCTEAMVFDFLSDKVDYRHSHTYHNSPERILGLGYSFSRNVVIRNDYMPFEFTLCVCKDDRFDQSDPVFNAHKLRT